MSNASDFVIENGVLKKYIGAGGDVVIPDGVTAIGKDAFRYCGHLNSVVIPDSVTSIGNWACVGCESLTSVVIPGGVTAIGECAFSGCLSLTSIVIPDSVTTITSYAFLGCSNLTDVVIPDSVTAIGACAFGGCSSLTGIAIPDSVTTIGECAFSGCSSLTGIVIPDSVTTIEAGAFRGCTSLTGIVIPDGVTAIEKRTFYGCSNLTDVVIPDSVTTIGEMAFKECYRLTRIKIPAGIEKIEKDAFMTGSHMRWPIRGSIVIPKAYYFSGELRIDILNLSALPSWTRLLAVLCLLDDGAQKTDPRYEGYIKFIKANAAKMMWEAMIYPELLALMCQEKLIGAKDIEKFVDAAGKIGDPALIAMLLDYQVNKLTDKQKEAVVKRKEKQEDILFDRAAARMDKEGISGLNFAVAGKLETFDSSKELKVFIEENGGKLMSSVSLKIDFLIMNEDTLHNEKEKRAKELGIEIITEHQFNLKAGRHFRIKPNGELTEYVGPGGDVMIPDTVTVIGDEAFAGCETLKTVTIPNGVTSIGGCAFENCRNLEMVTISDSVTRIKIGAFGSCRKLRVVKIGGSNIEIQFPFHRSPHVTIHAPAGSSAEDYAKEHNIPFVAE